MSIALVQSKLCGSNTGTFSTGTSTLSATGTFTSDTTAGNVLIIASYAKQTINSGAAGFASTSVSATTSGLTWTQRLNGGYDSGSGVGGIRKRADFLICPNAASTSSATTITVTLTFTVGAATNVTQVVEFAVYEFSGLSTSTSLTTGGLLVDTSATRGTQTGTTPNWSTITTTKSDLIIASFIGDSAVQTAGSGYTLGRDSSVVPTGQVQYQLNSSIGSVATSFAGGTQATWGGAVLAFKPPASTGGRDYGFFFG